MERLGNDGHRREAAAELARIEGQLVQAEQQLAEARRTAQERQPSYAVMPYEGPHQTRRRPIYLECCATAVILQPEGVAFTVDDFLGPLGPGNPLDVALRATREYLLKARPTTAEVEEPYPLVLVRPDGIEAYYAARTAMLSWGGEFGYELIGQDWKLQFPKASPQLASEVREVVASARVRQQQLVAAAPRHYGPRQSSAKYRVAPFRGGIVPDGDADEGDEPSGYGGYSPRSAFGRSGRSFGTGTGGTETGGTGTGGTGTGGTVAGSASGGTGGTAAGMAQGSAGVAASNAAGSPMAAGSARAGDSGQASQNAAMPGFVVGRPPREENPLRESPAADRVATVVRPGEWIEKPPPAGKPPDKPKEPPKDRPKVRSLAETRGHNWGLPDAARGSVAVTRSVRVDCYSERLVIVPDAGVAGGQIIPLGDRTAGSIDALISSVWDHMDTWGIAGKGMYWRPVLNFHVAPNGEARFDELKALLDGSGLEVRRHEG